MPSTTPSIKPNKAPAEPSSNQITKDEYLAELMRLERHNKQLLLMARAAQDNIQQSTQPSQAEEGLDQRRR